MHEFNILLNNIWSEELMSTCGTRSDQHLQQRRMFNIDPVPQDVPTEPKWDSSTSASGVQWLHSPQHLQDLQLGNRFCLDLPRGPQHQWCLGHHGEWQLLWPLCIPTVFGIWRNNNVGQVGCNNYPTSHSLCQQVWHQSGAQHDADWEPHPWVSNTSWLHGGEDSTRSTSTAHSSIGCPTPWANRTFNCYASSWINWRSTRWSGNPTRLRRWVTTNTPHTWWLDQHQRITTDVKLQAYVVQWSTTFKRWWVDNRVVNSRAGERIQHTLHHHVYNMLCDYGSNRALGSTYQHSVHMSKTTAAEWTV